VREQDRPLVANPFVEPDLSFGGFGREVRRFVSNANSHFASVLVAGRRAVRRERTWLTRGSRIPVERYGTKKLYSARLVPMTFE
jgi:hypothetical protein